MFILEYDPENGVCMPDYKIEAWLLDTFNSSESQHVNVGSQIIIEVARALVAEGKISHNKIQFKFENEIIEIYNTGFTKTWPKGFCFMQSNTSYRVLCPGKENHDPTVKLAA